MKKVAALFLLGILLVSSFAGCNNTNDNSKATEPTTKAEQTTGKKTEPMKQQ